MMNSATTPRCPRCTGPLERHRDRYGVYVSCFLCGYARDLNSVATLDLTTPSDPEEYARPRS
jgi:hypothetical protein